MSKFKIGDKVKYLGPTDNAWITPGATGVVTGFSSRATRILCPWDKCNNDYNSVWDARIDECELVESFAEVPSDIIESVEPIIRKGDKFDSGKPQMRFLTQEFLEGTALAQTYGSKKYGPFNFKKGIESMALYDAAMRHLIAWGNGQDNDLESNLSHLGHAAANLNMLMWMLVNKPEMDDRWKE